MASDEIKKLANCERSYLPDTELRHAKGCDPRCGLCVTRLKLLEAAESLGYERGIRDWYDGKDSAPEPGAPTPTRLSNVAAQRLVAEMIEFLEKGGWNSETDEIDDRISDWLMNAKYPKEADRVAAEPPSVAAPTTPRIYAASRASLPSRVAMWKELRNEGFNIVSSWIDEAEPGATADLGQLWERIVSEITSADGLVLYVEAEDFPLKGAFIEAGIALGMCKPVHVVCPDLDFAAPSYRPIGSWIMHPNVVRFKNVRQACNAKFVAATEATVFKCAACPHETYDFVAAQEHAGSHAGDPLTAEQFTQACESQGASVGKEFLEKAQTLTEPSGVEAGQTFEQWWAEKGGDFYGCSSIWGARAAWDKQTEEIARLTRLVSVLQEGKDTWRRAATADYAKLVEAEAELERLRPSKEKPSEAAAK